MPQTVKLTEFTYPQTAAPWMTLPATQQPHWHHHPEYDLIEAELSGALPLVAHSEIREARRAAASRRADAPVASTAKAS